MSHIPADFNNKGLHFNWFCEMNNYSHCLSDIIFKLPIQNFYMKAPKVANVLSFIVVGRV